VGRPQAVRALLALSACLATASSAAAAGPEAPPPPRPVDPALVVRLIEKAHRLDLGHDPHWLRLGHYRKKPLVGWESEADGPDFFLDPHGKTDPAGELDATLRAAFGTVPQPPAEVARGLLPPLCRFPARLAVLQQRLGFDPGLLPQVDCPKLDEFWRRVQPESVSLIFSSYYLNNPASAFGHTFLRIRKRGDLLSREKRELLDFAVDFSATVDTGNPVVYAFKGLFGLFPGTFNLKPYFYKVREYNDYESRDLFEYDLQLTPSEVALLVAHLFELGSTWFDYYYVDENCSYHVLAALEAAAPRLHLLDRLGVPVVPADTVKVLFDNPGLVGEIHYRPSATTQFEARVKGMPGAEKELVDQLGSAPAAPLPGLAPAAQARLLDAAADLVDVRFAKELIHDPSGTGGQLKQALLERRAALGVASPPLAVPPPDQLPHQAHGSMLLSAGGVYSDAEQGAATLGYRLALHGLEDPAGGYPDLAQIEFFPLQLRLLGEGPVLRLERLDFIDALSLHDMNRFDHRLSWRVRAGAERLHDPGCAGCLVGNLEIGSGAATVLGPLVLWSTLDTVVQFSSALQGIDGARALRVGVGPSLGARLRLGERLTASAGGRAFWMPAAAGSGSWSLEAALRLVATPAVSFGLRGSALPDAREAALEAIYFY
jgi:hypothetical protein